MHSKVRVAHCREAKESWNWVKNCQFTKLIRRVSAKTNRSLRKTDESKVRIKNIIYQVILGRKGKGEDRRICWWVGGTAWNDSRPGEYY